MRIRIFKFHAAHKVAVLEIFLLLVILETSLDIFVDVYCEIFIIYSVTEVCFCEIFALLTKTY